MPGNEVGDRVHNFFAQDNLSQGLHSQAVGGNWPPVNNEWVGNQKQVGAPNSNPRFYNPQQSEIERAPSQHGFNFMQTTSRPEFANDPSQNQQQNPNGHMYGRHVLQTRPDEANFLQLDTDTNQNNMNPRGFLGYEAQHEGVSEQISRNSDRSEAFDANGSLDLFGRQNQMNNQHPGFLQPVQQQQSGFNDIQHMQMLRKMQELQRQKSMNRASHVLINGTSTSESSWAEPVTGNPNWLHRGGSPVVQGSSSGLMFSPELGQAQRSTGFVKQQVDQSLYGVPVSATMGPLNQYNYVAGNSFSGNRYPGIQEQPVIQNMEQNQQMKSEIKANSSHGAASLDPDEEKILFGSDGNIWDAFGSNENMGEGISNLLDDNEFTSELPSLQSGSWSALMQSAVAETTSSNINSQEDWASLNIQNLENPSKMNKHHSNTGVQNGLSNNKQNDWNPSNSAPGDASLNINNNLLRQLQNNNHKRVKHEEIGQGDGIWMVDSNNNNGLPNPNNENTSMGSPQINREGFTVNTANGDNHLGQFLSNNHQLNYWKNVQSSVNLGKSQLIPNQVSEPSFNSSDKEIESRSKRENSNDSYQSSSSHQANTVRLRENSLSDAGDLRPLPWTKQSLLDQAGRKTSGQRKFQYHPMGNLDEDVEVPYGARQVSSQHFQGLRGQDQANLGHVKIGGQVPKSTAETGKGHVHDIEGITKGSHDTRPKGMIVGHVPNMFAQFDKSVGLSTSEKASQPSQNMLDLLHKVDKSRDHGTLRHFKSSERHLPSETTPEPEHSDGSFGGLQRTHSSNSQGPSLQLGFPSQRVPLPNNTSPGGVLIANSNSLTQAHVSHNLRDKGPAMLPSLPPKNNIISSSEQNAREFLAHRMMSNLSSSLGAGLSNSRSQLQNGQMVGAREVELTNNSDKESLNRRNGLNNDQSAEGRLPNIASFGHERVQAPSRMLPTQQQLFATQGRQEHLNVFQSGQINIVESTSLNPQNPEDQEAEKKRNLPYFGASSLNSQGLVSVPSQNVLSGMVDQGQMTNAPLGKESVPDATQRDLEAFGRSLKPNNFHQNYSLMNQTSAMKNADNDPCNRATKRLKGPDNVVVDDIEQNVPSGQCEVQISIPSKNVISTKAEHSHISPQMAPSWFDQHGTLKNSQVSQRFDTVRSVEQPFSVGKLSGGLETQNSKEQAGPTPLQMNVGVENVVTVRPEKRRLATDDLHPWLVEVSGRTKNLQGICMGATEWSRSANRLMEKVNDDGEVIEHVLPVPRPKRRLISTTLLMQQLLRPPPAEILSKDASSNQESVVYHTARLALGDACNLVSLASGASCQSDKSKSSERVDIDRLSKVMEDFVSKAGKLEDEFLRLDKKASILDLRVENQEVERFSVITRFAKFHGRAQPDGPEGSSSEAAAHALKPFPQRYVTAVALPANLPDGVQCLSL